MRNAGSFFTGGGNYKFANFTALTSLNFSHAGLSGAFPEFTNPVLSSLNLVYTSIRGGTNAGDTTYVIPAETFENTPLLSDLQILSGNLLTSPIHPDAFSNLSELSNLYYYSFGRTGGAVPNLGGCPKLSSLQLSHNAFTGNLPSLNSLSNLRTAYLNHNNFSGSVPTYRNLANLYRLHIHNNNLDSLPKFTNLPALTYFYAHNNVIEGAVPSFADCPNLYYLILFNNKFTTYTQGSFSTLYSINYIDISGNNLTQQAVDDILADLLTNYNAVNRGRVTVNLRGNAIPSETGQEDLEILRSKGWSVTTS
jgi:Leucine-rich repeat (LRR) protein